jgi:hypothetical protein
MAAQQRTDGVLGAGPLQYKPSTVVDQLRQERVWIDGM